MSFWKENRCINETDSANNISQHPLFLTWPKNVGFRIKMTVKKVKDLLPNLDILEIWSKPKYFPPIELERWCHKYPPLSQQIFIFLPSYEARSRVRSLQWPPCPLNVAFQLNPNLAEHILYLWIYFFVYYILFYF